LPNATRGHLSDVERASIGATHYLKAVEALKSDDGTKVIAKMKEMPTDDPLFGGTVRRRPQIIRRIWSK
jgi:hypothetical protein